MEALVTALTNYKKGTSGLVIKYTGKFDFSTITDPCAQHSKAAQVVDIKDMSNVTIVGAPGAAINFGLHFSRVNNIIVRNLKIGYIPGAGDAIGIESDSYGFWIDHNELFSSMVECEGAGDLEFDGLLDIKDGAHNMTFSYNYFHDHHKVGLMGSSDSDLGDRLVTIHHNRYENVGSRLPLQRGGITHIYNNYYNAVMVTGINVRMGGIALIESNYFENSKNPVTTRDSDAIGYWDLRNNYVGAGITWSAGDAPYANADAWTTSKAFTATLGYDYTADPAACIKAIVTATAGAKL
jgi:pectate lyase